MRHLVLEKNRKFVLRTQNYKSLAPDEVRIRAAYAGISFTDTIIQRGWYRYQTEHLPLPYTPGFEASGVITEVGANVSNYSVGDKVVVLDRYGCFSEEILVTTDKVISLLPDTDLRWAASLPVNFFTAFHALNNIIRIFPDSTILVESAAGGVGGMLTQLAARKHRVYGLLGNPANSAYVLSLGADRVFATDNIPKNQAFDVIFSASGANMGKFLPNLRTNGKLVLYGFHSLVPSGLTQFIRALAILFRQPKINPFELVYNNRTVVGFNIIQFNPTDLEYSTAKQAFLDEIREKTLTRHTITSFPIDAYQDAFTLLTDRTHRGKIVLEF